MQKTERLCALTDGVYAIAITLLIFSVTLSKTGGTFDREAARELMRHIMMYAIGFVGIAVLWLSNHRTYAHITGYRSRLGTLTLLHLFFVVLIPAMTSITIRFEGQWLPNLFYIGTYLGAVLTQKGTARYLYRHRMIGNASIEKKEELYDAAYQWVINGVVCGAVVFVFLLPWLSAVILGGGFLLAWVVRAYVNKKYHYLEREDNAEQEQTVLQTQMADLIRRLKELEREGRDGK